MEKKDSAYIKGLAEKQDKAGATFIDVNAGAFVYDELEKLEWALKQVQEVTKNRSRSTVRVPRRSSSA